MTDLNSQVQTIAPYMLQRTSYAVPQHDQHGNSQELQYTSLPASNSEGTEGHTSMSAVLSGQIETGTWEGNPVDGMSTLFVVR